MVKAKYDDKCKNLHKKRRYSDIRYFYEKVFLRGTCLSQLTLKNVRKTCEAEVDVITKAKKVLNPPFMTADPMSDRVSIVRVFLSSSWLTKNV